ncbi:phage terminase small subunit P27 family [Paracoccus saliphilus]|uniref:Phage terminase small subunit P27 family n=1 Tax=Paracoccus saliphilus TaxID=405559 RepID=A0AA45W293_9RHOB|nr:phage terminase small subunit P27 family [Paracoccus saliphilus]WCR01917.1 phage terminase small subunit P27 family [Paracoccus saliphilus]SIS65159.1 phage terminase, small subunit, putative, P27 family [Paracoccus saliphilus]
MKGTKPALQQDQDAILRSIPAPDWLDPKARAEWDRVMPVLTERRILTDADLGGLENYCIAIGRARQMEAAIQVEADPELMLKFVRVQDKAMASARQLAAELGLTPVSRSRPAIRDDEDGDDTPNPLGMG